MSAIVGLYRLGGSAVSSEEVSAMLRAMPHRCIDGKGFWAEGSVGLAHGMLQTTPESLYERLPLTDASGRFTITADARIDNRSELIDLLGLEGQHPAPTDSGLILAAYQKWGQACLDHLVGVFAFALWDADRQVLFCARDPFGIRPLYYHHENELFAFGTEIKAITTLGCFQGRLNEVRIADALVNNRQDAKETIYTGIYRLPGAHALLASSSGIEVWRYYTLKPASGLEGLSDEEYEQRFREAFVEAVRCRLRSAYPVGSQLSGGLDSSAVTCVARDLMCQNGEELATFSLVFDEIEECDERPFINAVLAQGGMKPYYVAGDTVGPLGNLDEVYDTLDDGLAVGTQHLVWELLRAGKEAGVRVMLDGIDGDTTVDHGHRYLRELVKDQEWEAFNSEVALLEHRFRSAAQTQGFERILASPTAVVRTMALPVLDQHAEEGHKVRLIRDAASLRKYLGVSAKSLLRKYWWRLMLPNRLLLIRRRRQTAKANQEPSNTDKGGALDVIDPAFAVRVGALKRLVDLKVDIPPDSVRGAQLAFLSSNSFVGGLEIMDHFAAVHGMEARHPFFDVRLIELCLALPPSQSLSGGWTRAILRHALAYTLPEKIAWRVGKAQMSASYQHGLFVLDKDLLRKHVADIGPLGSYINQSKVYAMLEEGEGLSSEDQVRLGKIAAISIWLKKRFTL